MSSVSHELRTPLNGSITMLSLANQDDSISMHIKEKYLKPALYSSQMLLFLINDFLDYSKYNFLKKIQLSF